MRGRRLRGPRVLIYPPYGAKGNPDRAEQKVKSNWEREVDQLCTARNLLVGLGSVPLNLEGSEDEPRDITERRTMRNAVIVQLVAFHERCRGGHSRRTGARKR